MKDLPIIITDNREQNPLVFGNLPSEAGTLQSGDYSVRGLEHEIAIERKSIADLCQSVTRGREHFERELHRLRGYSFARILIVGDPYEVTRHSQNPKAVFSSLSAFEARYGIPAVWEADPANAALLVERWGWFFHRERTRAHGSGKADPCPIPAANVKGRARAILAATSPSPAAMAPPPH
jgi:DNA excision repair protein ERCC-4